VAIRLLAGAAAAAPIPLAFAWIGDAVPFEQRQPVLARFLTAQIAGIILGQAAGGVLGEAIGWRGVFIAVGAIHVLAGLAMLVELRLNPAAQPAGGSRRGGPGDVAATILGLVGRRWVRIMMVAVAIEGMAFYGALAYVGADLHHRYGVSLGVAGGLIATYALGAIVYSLNARRLLAALGERQLVLAGGGVLAIGFLALAAAPAVGLVPPAMVLLGLGFYMFHNTLQSNATQMAPESRGLGVSLFAFALFLGQSLGVWLFAGIVDRWGAPAIYLAAAMALPLVAVWFAGRLAGRPAA
jgi:predicted MFS family arabinose efflux permease